jgi:hypothetical protein
MPPRKFKYWSNQIGSTETVDPASLYKLAGSTVVRTNLVQQKSPGKLVQAGRANSFVNQLGSTQLVTGQACASWPGLQLVEPTWCKQLLTGQACAIWTCQQLL